MRVVAYIPASSLARRHRREITSQCQRLGHEIAGVTSDPAEAKRMRDAGEVAKIVVARPIHATHLDPDLIVAEVPHHRPQPRALAAWAALAGAGAAVWAWTRRQPALAGGIATVTAAGVAAVVLLPVLAGPGPTDPGTVPPVAAPAPPVVEDYLDLPVPDPEPEPTAEANAPAVVDPVQPLPPAVELPELDPVAVELPAVPELPAGQPPPPATPPAPTPAPEPTEAVPSPEPEPEPAETTPLLLCADVELLGAIQIELCL